MSLKVVSLGDVATVRRDTVDPRSLTLDTLYVGLENIERGGTFTDVKTVAEVKPVSTKFRFTEDQVLYGKLRPYLAKVARPDFSGICSTDILPITPGEQLDRDYLAHFLLRPESVALATSRASGANLPRLSPDELSALQVPLPSLEEQRRIAEVLDRADELRAKRRQALVYLNELTRAIFLDMFGDPSSNTNHLPIKCLGELIHIGTGSTPSRSVADYYGGSIPWVKTAEVNGHVIENTEEMLTEAGLASIRMRTYPAGSLVVALYGQGKTRGQCAILGIEAATNQACAVLPPNRAYDTSFMFTQLQLSYERLRSLGRGGSQANLNLRLVNDFEVMLPPVAWQRQYADRVSRVKSVRATQHAQLRELDGLFAALRDRAFAGLL